MPKVVVTEAELKQIIKTVLSEQDVTNIADPMDQTLNVSELSTPTAQAKLNLINKLSEKTPGWERNIGAITFRDVARLIDDIKPEPMPTIDPNSPSTGINGFLDACIYALMINKQTVRPYVLGSKETVASQLALKSKNQIFEIVTDDVYYGDTSKYPNNAGFKKSNLNDFYSTIVVAGGAPFEQIVSGLKKDGTLLSYEAPEVASKIREYADNVMSTIEDKAKSLVEKYNTPAYRNFLYQPLLSPPIWLLATNENSPLYTPWKMTWSACNLFSKALKEDGIFGLLSMTACFNKYIKSGRSSDQAGISGADAALNERLARRVILSDADLAHVINAALKAKLNELKVPTVSDIRTGAKQIASDIATGFGRTGRGSEDLEDELKLANKLGSFIKDTEVKGSFIRFEDSIDTVKNSFTSVFGDDAANVFNDILDGLDETLRSRSANFSVNLPGDVYDIYSELGKLFIKKATGEPITREALDEVIKKINALELGKRESLQRVMTSDDRSLSQGTSNIASLLQISSDQFNRLISPKLLEKYRRSGVSEIMYFGSPYPMVEIRGNAYTIRNQPRPGSPELAVYNDIKDDIQKITDSFSAVQRSYASKLNEFVREFVSEITKSDDGKMPNVDVIEDKLAAKLDVTRLKDIFKGAVKFGGRAAFDPDQFVEGVKGLLDTDENKSFAAAKVLANILGAQLSTAQVFSFGGQYARRGAMSFTKGDRFLKKKGSILFVDTIIGFLLTSGVGLAFRGDDKSEGGFIDWIKSPWVSTTWYSQTTNVPGLAGKLFDIIIKAPVPEEFAFDIEDALNMFIDAFQSFAAIAVTPTEASMQFSFESGAAQEIANRVESTANVLESDARQAKQAAPAVLELIGAQTPQQRQQILARLKGIHGSIASARVQATTADTGGAEDFVIANLESARQDNIGAVVICLGSFDDKTKRLSGVDALLSTLSSNKKISTDNYERDPAGSGEDYWLQLKYPLARGLTEDTLIGLFVGMGTGADDIAGVDFYMTKLYGDRYTALKNEVSTKIEADPAAEADILAGFEEYQKIWHEVGNNYAAVLAPVVASPTK